MCVFAWVCDKVPPLEREALIVQTEWLCVIMVSINLGWVGGPVRLSIHPCLSSFSFSLPVFLYRAHTNTHARTHTHTHTHTHTSIRTLTVTNPPGEGGCFIVWRRAKGSELYQETRRVPKTFGASEPLAALVCYLESRHEKHGPFTHWEPLTFYINAACSQESKEEGEEGAKEMQ